MFARPLPRLAVATAVCLAVVAGLVPAAGTVAEIALAVVGGMFAWDMFCFWRQSPRGLRRRQDLELCAGILLVTVLLVWASFSQLG